MPGADHFVVDGRVVRCIGEVDLASAPALRDAITEAINNGGDVVVDLAATSFLDSVGMSVLVQAARFAEQTGQRISVVGAHGLVRRVLDLAGLSQVLPIFDSFAEAEAATR